MKEGSYSHYKLVRQAIMKKMTGAIRFHSIQSTDGKLFFLDGNICYNKSNRSLIEFISQPMEYASWHPISHSMRDVYNERSISHALISTHWSDEDVEMISIMFSKLPEVSVAFLDFDFHNPLTNMSHELFYRQSRAYPNFKVSDFLFANEAKDILLAHRVKVVSFNYMLGLIKAKAPLPKPIQANPSATGQAHKTGMLWKIFDKIKGIQ